MIPSLKIALGRGRRDKAGAAFITLLSLLVLIALCVAGCNGGSAPKSEKTNESKLAVVTTTGILADFVRNVGGDRVQVRPIVPPGADIHTFQATPSDSIAISEASIIVSNGSGLDDFLEPVLNSAKSSDALHLVASKSLKIQPLKVLAFPGSVEEHRDELQDEGENVRHGDPHFWQNPLHAVQYVERIRDGLIEVDPTGVQRYRENAFAYIEQLNALDREITDTLNVISASRRHLVTFHDSFGYFAARYGLGVSAFVPDDASDVTPGRVIDVMKRIKQQGIPAVFAEPQFSPDVMERAAKDANVLLGPIYSDALDANAPTYIEMMRFNANSLVKYLR